MKKRLSEVQSSGFLKQAEAGLPVKELCRKHSFSGAWFRTRLSKLGGMDVTNAKRLKAMEQENEHLKAQSVAFAQQRRQFGYRQIHALLRREGIDAIDLAGFAIAFARY